MLEKAAAPEQEYLAFISYRHSDNTEEDQQWASWLHKQLEVYDVPDDLIGTTNLRGEIIPAQIYPVFLDELSLPAESDLSSAITQALDRSRFLIVLCSPGAVQSRYVNEEILHFKRTGKSGRIMAALILGEPNASIDAAKIEDSERDETLECFPPALQYELNVDGQLDKTNPTEPIAANFRLPDGGKGVTNPNVYKKQLLKNGRSKADAERLSHLYEEQINNARLKIIAGILGVPLEQLTQRDKVYQLNKAQQATRRFRKIALGMGVLALVAVVAGSIAVVQMRIAKAEQERAENLLAKIQYNLRFMLDLRETLDKYVPQHERIEFIQLIDVVVNVLQENSSPIETQHQIARALRQKADQAFVNDKLNPIDALPLYIEAAGEMFKLSQMAPDDLQIQYDLSVINGTIGQLQLRLGKPAFALQYHQDSLEMAQAVTNIMPSNSSFRQNLSVVYENIGDVQKSLSHTDLALKSYNDSLAIRQALNELDPTDTEYQRSLMMSYTRIGDLQLALGNNDAALKAYQDSLAIAQTLVKLDPTNTQFKSDLSFGYGQIGKWQVQQGNIDAALKKYQESFDITQSMVMLDPSNTDYQHDLSGLYSALAFCQLNLGNNEEALKLYQEVMTIIQSLTKHDPSNFIYQFDLQGVYYQIGKLKQDLGNIDAAIKLYQEALVIAQSLSTLQPANITVLGDLARTYEALGGQQLRQGDTDSAVKSYQDGLASRQSIAKLDPTSVDFQSDLYWSYNNIGDLLVSLGKTDIALKSYQDSLAIVQALNKLTPNNTKYQYNIGLIYNNIGGVEYLIGNTNEALKAYQESLEVLQTLNRIDPSNNQLQRDMSIAYGNIGYQLLSLGQTDDAINAFKEGFALAETLTINAPDNTEFQNDMWLSHMKLFDGYKANKEFKVAKTHLEKALKLIKKMQKNGTLAKDDVHTIQNMQSELRDLAKKIKH